MPKNSPCPPESDEPAPPPGPPSPGPCPSGEALRSFLEGRSSGPEEREILAHVDQCERCRIALGDLATDPELREWLRQCGPLRCGPPDEPGLARLIDRLAAMRGRDRGGAHGPAGCPGDDRDHGPAAHEAGPRPGPRPAGSGPAR